MADRVEVIVDLIGKDEAIAGLKEIQNLAKTINGSKPKLDVDTSGVKKAEGEVQSFARKTRNFFGAVFRGVGNFSQTTGGILTTLSSTMRRAGMSLTQMSNLFGGSLFNKAMYTVAGKAVNLFNQGISRSIERFDTFRTFPKLMEQIGFSAADSEAAIQKLNDAVLGTPTALNTIVESSKPLIQLYNDIEKGTDLAIAANNAFLANGSDAAQIANGMSQIQDILSKGELTGTEWQSLLTSMGVSTQYVAEAMGYGADEMDNFRAALYDGAIDAREFLDALIEVGTGTGKLADAASLSKDMLTSSIENVKTAFSNLGETVLETFDEILTEHTGEGLAENITKISGAIKTHLIPAVSGFLKEHGDDIMGFFEKLRSFPWGQLASSVVENAGKMFDFFGNILDEVGMNNIVGFISFSLTWAGPLGKALRLLAAPVDIIGSLMTRFGGLSRRFGRFLGKGRKIGGGAGGARGVGTSLLGAAGFVGIIAEIGLVVAEYAKVAEYVGSRDLGNFNKNIGPILKMAGGMTAITGAITTVMTALQKAGMGVDVLIGEGLTAGFGAVVGFMGEVIGVYADIAGKIGGLELSNFDSNWDKVNRLIGEFLPGIALMVGGLSAVTGFTGGIGGLAVLVGELLTAGFLELMNGTADVIGKFTDVAAKIASTEMPSDEQISKTGEVFSKLGDLFTEMDIGLGWFEKGRFDRAIDALDEVVESFSAFEKADQIKADLDNAGKNLKTIVEVMSDISVMMSDAFGEYDASQTAEDQARIAENMSSVVASLGEMATQFNDMKGELDALGMAFDDDGNLMDMSRFNKIKDGVLELSKTMGELFTTIATSFGSSSWRDKVNTAERESNVTDSMNTVLTNLQEAVGIFTEIEGILPDAGLWSKNSNETYVKFEKARDGLLALVEGINMISDAITPNLDDFEATTREMVSSLQGDIAGNMSTIMSTLSEITGTVGQLDTEQMGIGRDIHTWSGEDYFDRQINNLKKMIEGISKVMDELSPDGAIKSLLEKWESINKAEIAKNIGDAMEAINRIVENVNALQLTAVELDPKQFEEVSEKIREVLNTISIMMDSLADDTNIGRGEAGSGTKTYDQITGDLQNLLDAMRHIKEIVSAITEMTSGLDEVIDTQAAVKIGNIMRQISTSLNKIPEDAEEIMARVENMKTAIEAVKELMQSIVDMKANMDTIGTEDAAGQMGGIIGGVVQALGGADIEAVKTNLFELSGALGGIKSNLENLAAIDLGDLGGSVETLYSAMGDLNGVLETCATNLANVANAGHRAATHINAAGNAAENRRGALQSLTGTARFLASALGRAAGSARSLGSAIAALQNKTVTVTYNEVRNVSTNNSGGSAIRSSGPLRRASGGIVPQYRAIGGIMRPKGTDTVPAMLTPGEFVMRRAAVNKLGLAFMEKVNRMDIPGAITQLMRGVRMPSGSGVTYNNQRTYDNHAVVNQYFRGQKDKKASYRRASRYVNAL